MVNYGIQIAAARAPQSQVVPAATLLKKGCCFIDAAGLAALVSGEERLKERGLRLLLYGVEGQVLRLLSVTGLTGNGMLIAGSEEEAKRSLGGEEASLTLRDTVARS